MILWAPAACPETFGKSDQPFASDCMQADNEGGKKHLKQKERKAKKQCLGFPS